MINLFRVFYNLITVLLWSFVISHIYLRKARNQTQSLTENVFTTKNEERTWVVDIKSR